MGKFEFKCSCGNKIAIETEKNEDKLKKVKGGEWSPLLTSQGGEKWVDDSSLGIGVRCKKCAKHTFAYNFTSTADQIETMDKPKDGQFIAVFCEPCGRGFGTVDLTCPTCGTQY
ncbi:MAG: hypothetical protein ACW98Y_11280 [Candidatus Thorarchaeota archaeon]